MNKFKKGKAPVSVHKSLYSNYSNRNDVSTVKRCCLQQASELSYLDTSQTKQ